MMSELSKLLDSLSERVDGARYDAIDRRFRLSLACEPVDRPPVVVTYPYPKEVSFQPFPHREVFDDPEKMLYNELVSAFDTSIVLQQEIGDDLPFTVRANFGTVLVASMFGSTVEQREDNPPWIVHQGGRTPSLEEIADTDSSDFSTGWAPRATETMRLYQEVLSGYPELRKSVRVVLPDLQGPFDNLELIRGSDVFAELVENPEAVEHALANLAAAQVNLSRYFSQWTSEPYEGFCHQHAVMLKGSVLLRNDSCVMVSPAMYREQIAPHDEKVLHELGGGGLHSCGNIGHLVDEFLRLPSIRSLDLGQPELNDVDGIYRKALERGVPLIRVAVTAEEIDSGSYRKRFPTGAVLLHRAVNFEEARRVVFALRI